MEQNSSIRIFFFEHRRNMPKGEMRLIGTKKLIMLANEEYGQERLVKGLINCGTIFHRDDIEFEAIINEEKRMMWILDKYNIRNALEVLQIALLNSNNNLAKMHLKDYNI